MEQMIRNYSSEFGGTELTPEASIESIVLQIREKDSIIEELRKENELLKNKMKELGKFSNSKKAPQSRYWSKDEHERFLEALEKFGKKDVKSISAYVGTRSPTQVRTHSQKYFLKLKRESERKKKGMRKGKKAYNDSSESDDVLSDDNNQNFEVVYQKDQKMNQKPLTTNIMTNTTIPIHTAHHQGFDPSSPDAQALINGIRKYDHENNMKKKIEMIQKDFLPHKSVEEIAQMITSYPILFNPESNDPISRYYYLPQQYMIPTASFQSTNFTRATQFHDSISGSSTSSSASSSTTTQPTSQTILKQQDITRSTITEQEKDDEEDLENELQSLQNNNNKKSLSGGLSGFIGHTVLLSPTVFHGTPLVLGSPLMSHTPILSESLTPIQQGFPMGKMPTSPLYFIGADHRK